MRTEIRRDNYTLTVEREVIEYRTLGHHEIDPHWSYADPNGHVHHSLDSLTWVVTGTYWCDTCNDEHEEGEYRCAICGAVVETKWRWVDESQIPHYLPGLASARLEIREGFERHVYHVRPDEMPPIVDAKDNASPEWLARVTSRDPDEWSYSEVAGQRER